MFDLVISDSPRMRFGAGSSVAIGPATAVANAVKTSQLEDEPEIFTLVMKGRKLN